MKIFNFMTQHTLSQAQVETGLISPVMTAEQQDKLKKLMIVDPHAKAHDVKIQAFELAQLIKEILNFNDVDLGRVHIMGQTELMFYLYGYLREELIQVYVSTTERRSVEVKNPDGSVSKNSIFEFVQLRPVV